MLKHIRILGWTFNGTYAYLSFFIKGFHFIIMLGYSLSPKKSVVCFIGLEGEPKEWKERREGRRKERHNMEIVEKYKRYHTVSLRKVC